MDVLFQPPTVEYCEVVLNAIIARPWYALSNIAFLIAGSVMLHQGGQHSKAFGGLALLVGTLSFVYDSTFTYLSQLVPRRAATAPKTATPRRLWRRTWPHHPLQGLRRQHHIWHRRTWLCWQRAISYSHQEAFTTRAVAPCFRTFCHWCSILAQRYHSALLRGHRTAERASYIPLYERREHLSTV